MSELSIGNLKTILRFRFFFVIYIIFNCFMPLFASYERVASLNIFHRHLERLGIEQSWSVLIDSFIATVVVYSILYAFVLYMYMYASLYQIIQNIEAKMDFSNSFPVDECQLICFWKLRTKFCDLRKRTQKTYGIIALIFFMAMFGIVVLYVLSITLARADPANVFVFFIIFANFFLLPTFLSCILIDNFVEFDECLNHKLHRLLNDVSFSNVDPNQFKVLSAAQRRLFLNQLRLHMRVPVTVGWQLFEIDRKLLFYFCNTTITFVVMVYNLLIRLWSEHVL